MSENSSDIVKMSARNLEVDDLVWAKVLRSPYWPAKISQPNEMNPYDSIPHHFVYLFGTHRNVWVPDANIVLHSGDMLENFHISKKSTLFHNAFEEMKHEIEKKEKLNTYSQGEKMSLGKSSIIKLPNFPTASVGEHSFEKPAIPAMESVNKSLLTSTKKKSFPIKCNLNNIRYSKKLGKFYTKVPQKRKHSNSFTNSKLMPTTTKYCKILPSTSNDYQLPSTSNDYQLPSTSKDYQLPSTSKDYQLPSTSKDLQIPSTSKDYPFPSTSKDYLFPSTSKDYQLPSTSKDYQLPKTSKDYQLPSTSKDYQPPSTSKDYQLPSTSKDYPFPSTSKDDELPLTLEDSELPSTSEKHKQPYTSKELINWKLDKLLSNEIPSSNVNKPAFDSITLLDDCDNIPSDGDQCIDNTAENLSLTVTINTMSKVVRATDKEIGFLGLGKIGSMFARQLLDSGHFLTVYNRSHEKCDEFVRDGAEKAKFPADVIKKCDITFCCVSDEKALDEVVFGEKGVLEGFDKWNKKGYKAYVEMTPIDPKKSQEIGKKISSKCGKYLEAPFMVTRELNKEESVLVICAGDDDLFHDCMTCFISISSEAFYTGLDVGAASTMKVILSMIMGAVHAALWETMSLACQCKLPLHTLVEFFCYGRLSCTSIVRIAFDLLEHDITFTSGFKSLQRDLNVASLLSESYSQPLPLAAAVNQYYVYAKQVDYKYLATKYKEAMNEQDIAENI